MLSFFAPKLGWKKSHLCCLSLFSLGQPTPSCISCMISSLTESIKRLTSSAKSGGGWLLMPGKGQNVAIDVWTKAVSLPSQVVCYWILHQKSPLARVLKYYTKHKSAAFPVPAAPLLSDHTVWATAEQQSSRFGKSWENDKKSKNPFISGPLWPERYQDQIILGKTFGKEYTIYIWNI